MKQSDAIQTLIKWLRSPDHGGYSKYGYDIYISHLVLAEIKKMGKNPPEDYKTAREWMPLFYNAAWELCRRGILRPGINEWQAQATDAGSAGEGFSITPFGQQWTNESDQDDFVPTEPERFAVLLEPYRTRFGPTFHERAQEAIRCYGAHAYLACCTMCGAAVESIILVAAIAKTNDEDKVVADYSGSRGRLKIENLLIGKANEALQREYRGLTTLLKYWRDASAHGRSAGIGDNEAFTSIALLLRTALFVNDNWDQLTRPEST